jgi:DNA polymerase-3 subunit beta
VDGEGLLLLATDAHRFSHCRYSAELSGLLEGQSAEAIVPPPALALLPRLLTGASPSTVIVFGATQVLVDTGAIQMVTRLIEGPYVDYRAVIPRGNDKTVVADTDRLLPAVRRVSILASAYTHQIRLSLRPGELELAANSPEIGGDAREVIPVQYDDVPMEIAYNAQYLQEILRRMAASKVLLQLSNQITAALIRPSEQTTSQDYFCLLMPLRATG